MDNEPLYTNFRNQLDWIIHQTPDETQTSVSQYLDKNDDYINHVRNNHNELSVRRLLQIADYLNTDPQCFFQPVRDTKERILEKTMEDLKSLSLEELKALSNYIRIRVNI